MSFGSDLDKFAKKATTRADAVRRKGAFDLFSSVIRSTPVATGRAKGSWAASIGTTRESPEREDKDGGEAIAEAAAVLASWSGDETAYLQSTIPYIERLEDGWSQQAPAGMVALNVKRFEPIIRKANSLVKK